MSTCVVCECLIVYPKDALDALECGHHPAQLCVSTNSLAGETILALRTELAQTQTALAEMTTDRNGWGDNSQRLEQALAAAKLEGARLRERLEATLHSTAWGHQHWDRMGTHGANCLLCIQQATVRDGIRELLATSPSLAADLGALRELVKAVNAIQTANLEEAELIALEEALANLPAWLKGRGE